MKKGLSLLIATIMMFSLSACGDKGGSDVPAETTGDVFAETTSATTEKNDDMTSSGDKNTSSEENKPEMSDDGVNVSAARSDVISFQTEGFNEYLYDFYPKGMFYWSEKDKYVTTPLNLKYVGDGLVIALDNFNYYDLKYFTEINTVSFIGMEIKTEYLVDALKNNPNIKTLNFWDCTGIDMAELSTLDTVTSVGFTYCDEITSADELGNMSQLTSISFAAMPIEDVSFVSKLEKLETLCVPNTNVEDLSFLASHPNVNYMNLFTGGTSIQSNVNVAYIDNRTECKPNDPTDIYGLDVSAYYTP